MTSFRQVQTDRPWLASAVGSRVRRSVDVSPYAALHWELYADTKHGAALRHLPSGHPQVNTVWMWAALLACAMSAWLQELCGLDRGNRRGRATIARLHRELICAPARTITHARSLQIRLPPGLRLLCTDLNRLALLPDPG